MEFDQPYNGPNIDWNFPSPTATPTTATFGHHVFNTPKPTPPSHFQDAFSTPQMPSYNTPQPTQSQYPSVTPVARPHTAIEGMGQYGYGAQAWGQQQAGRGMAYPGQVQAPFTAMGSSPYMPMQQASMQLAMNTSFDGTQMQTPPPTRGTMAKRLHQPNMAAFGTPPTIASRRFLTPQQHTLPSNDHLPQTQATPVQFPQLQFSPDMYNFSNPGPASAPIVPGNRNFWGPSTSPLQPAPADSLDDPFAPQGTTMSNEQVPRASLPYNMSFETPAMSSFPVMEPYERPASAATLPSTAAHTRPPPAAASVDPSLLYSSPAIARPSSRANKSKTQALALEAKRKDSAFSSHNRSEAPAPPKTTTHPGQSGLRRSNTITGGARPLASLPSANGPDMISRSQSFVQGPPRTASPLKRSGHFETTPESKTRPRPSVTLTVDENGRARIQQEDTPTRSIRERYPGLFDSDSESDEESDSTEKTPSRATSFTFEKRDERKAKAAKLDTPVENLEGLNIPRSGSSASLSKRVVPPSKAVVAATSQLRRQGSARKLASSRGVRRQPHARNAVPSIDTSPPEASSSQSTPPSIITSTPGSQQGPEVSPAHWQSTSFEDVDLSAGPTHSFDAANELEEHNRRWSIMSFEQQQQQPHSQHVSPQTSFQAPLQPHHSFGGPLLSPNHPHYPQQMIPPQNHLHQQFIPQGPLLRQIRCACGDASDRGVPLMQCPSCTQWVHVSCVGLDSSAAPLMDPTTAMTPPGFTCFLCTRPLSGRQI